MKKTTFAIVLLIFSSVSCSHGQEQPPKAKLSRHTDNVTTIAFSKTENGVLFSGSDDTTIVVWDCQKKESLHRFIPPEGLYPGVDKAKGTIFDPIVGRTPPFVHSISVSYDGKLVAVGATDRTVRLWSTSSNKQIRKIELPYSNEKYEIGNGVFAVAFCPKSQLIACGAFDGKIRLWSTDDEKFARIISGHSKVCYGLAFSSDGKTLASSSADKTIRLWDVETGKQKRVLERHTCYVFSVAFSPDDKYLVSAGGDVFVAMPVSELFLWEATTGKYLGDFSGHEGVVNSVAFSPDGKKLVSGGGNQHKKKGEVFVWDVNSRKRLSSFGGHESVVTSVGFSRDGTLIATGCADSHVRLFEVPAPK